MRHKPKFLALGQTEAVPIQSDENGKMAGAHAHGYKKYP
jgi:hypothetical protein